MNNLVRARAFSILLYLPPPGILERFLSKQLWRTKRVWYPGFIEVSSAGEFVAHGVFENSSSFETMEQALDNAHKRLRKKEEAEDEPSLFRGSKQSKRMQTNSTASQEMA